MTQQTDIAQQLEASVPSDEAPRINPEVDIEGAVSAAQAAEAVTQEPGAPPASPAPTAPPSPGSLVAFELPPEVAAAPPAPTPAGLANNERIELEQLRRSRAEILQFRQEQQAAIEIEQRQREYESRNIDPETAKYMAEEVRAESIRGQAKLNEQIMLGQIAEGRRNAALHYGKQYGVSPDALSGFETPQDMERYAQLLSYTGKMDRRLSNVEKGRVPEQHFDAGQAATGGPRSLDDQINYLADDSVDLEMTPEGQAALRKYLGLDS